MYIAHLSPRARIAVTVALIVLAFVLLACTGDNTCTTESGCIPN